MTAESGLTPAVHLNDFYIFIGKTTPSRLHFELKKYNYEPG